MNENVLRGIQLLDEKVPNWRKEINKKSLSMVWCGRCILGQLFGHYEDGLKELKISSRSQAIYLGFDANTSDDKSKIWDELTQSWIEAIGEQS